MPPRVTPAGPEAAALLARLHAAAFPDGGAWGAEAFTALLSAPGARALLAGAEGAAEGFIAFRTAADEGEVLTLAVVPAARRRGRGAALLAAALEAMAAAGARRAFLEVAADNAAAIALYEGGGFARSGLRRRYYARPGGRADALVMTRRL